MLQRYWKLRHFQGSLSRLVIIGIHLLATIQQQIHYSFIPRPTLFFVLRFPYTKNTAKTGKAWSHSSREWCQVDTRWTRGWSKEKGTNRKNNALDHPFKRSTTVLDLRCWRGQNYSLLEFIHYRFEYWPLPLRPPRVHSRDQWDQAFPVLCCLLLSVLYWTYTEEQRTGEAWEQG